MIVNVRLNAMRFDYKVIPDIFADLQDNDDPNLEQVLPRFGLVDTSSSRWENLKKRVADLNEAQTSGISTSYRVLFIGRHGEGYHNRTMDLYGHDKWAEYWAKLTTDGNMTWGPDPVLTETGIKQAYNVNRVWKEEVPLGIPIPETFYCSPLSRAITTAMISFEGIAFGEGDDRIVKNPRAIIKEKLRERNYDLHTCNKRRPRSFIQDTFPQFEIEQGFTEEDVMWHTDHTESDEHLRNRVREALDDIFANDNSTYISITAHAVTNKALREVLGAEPRRMPTGGVFAVVISITPIPDQA